MKEIGITVTTNLFKSGGGGGSSFGRTLEYFSQLDKRRKQRLYKAYKVDFDMFGYDHKPFM